MSSEIARKWLRELGFNTKKGTYMDGHEREDVVEHHGQFLRKMIGLGFLNRDNAPAPETKLALPEDLKTLRADVAKTVVLFHDESTSQANDYEHIQ